MSVRRTRIGLAVLLAVGVAMLASCGPRPRSLPALEANSMRRMLVVLSVRNPQLQVFHVERGTSFYGGPTVAGGIMALVATMASAAYVSSEVAQAMGGSPDTLRAQLRDWDLLGAFRTPFDADFVSKFQPSFVVVAADSDAVQAHQGSAGKQRAALVRLAEAAGADMVFDVRVAYGLLASTTEPPTVAVFPQVRAIKVANKKLLLDRDVWSTRAYWSSHTVKELAADNGRAFFAEFDAAVGGFCQQLSREIQRPLQQDRRSYWVDKP